MSDNENQWTTVAIRGRKPTVQGRVAATTRQVAAAGSHAAAVERRAEEGDLRKKRLDPASKQALVQARIAASMTQDQADAACALPKHTIKGIEAGTIIPNGTHLRAISRTLKVDLRLV